MLSSPRSASNPRREGVERQRLGAVERDRRVRRQQHPAAGARDARRSLLEPGLAVVVEGARRLVEQPQRGGRGKSRASASRRRCPADSQRHGQSAMPSRAKAASARSSTADPRPASAAQRRPEDQRLARGQGRLHRVVMADVVEPRVMRRRGRAATGAPPQESRPGGGREQPGDEAQQARLAAAVAPVSTSAPPAPRRNESPAKDQPLAPRRQARSSATKSAVIKSGAPSRQRPAREPARPPDAASRNIRQKGGSGGGIRSRLAARPTHSAAYEVWGTNL